MKNIKSKYLPLLSFVLIIILIIYGCTKKIINNNENNQIPMAMNAKLSSSELASFIDYFTLTISADDIDTIVAELTLEGSVIKGTVQVPIGSDRKFVLEAFDDTTVIYRGITLMNVTGESDTISVGMSPAVSLIRLSHRYLEINNNSLLTINVRVFNVQDLHSLSVKVFYDSLILIPDSAVSGFNINPDSTYFADSLFTDEAYLSLYLEHINPLGTLVDTNGNADMATLFFSQVRGSFNRTTAITIEPIELVNLAGDTIFPGEVYTDSSLINIVFSDTLLIVNPEILQFKALMDGSNPAPKTIAVTSQAIDSISYNASEDLTWMDLINPTGETPGEITVNVNISGLSDSIYPGIITITSTQTSNTPLNIPVTLEILLDTIVPPQPPQWPIGWMMRFGYDSISYSDTVGIMILWTGNSNMKGYNVYRSIGNEPFVTINDALIIDNPFDTIYPNIFYIDYNIDSLSINTHRYYVTAVNDSDVESEGSDTISLVPGDILDSMTVEQDIQIFQPQHRWFTTENPAFNWETVLNAESYLLLLLVGDWHAEDGDTAIWLYRNITTSITLGETQGITYIPLSLDYAPLIAGDKYKFEVYAINNDRTAYKHGESEFVIIGPDGFTGITETDDSGDIISVDIFDWCGADSLMPPPPDGSEATQFVLYPAYPNPDSMSTTITYALPVGTDVRLYIIDNNYNIVKELVNWIKDPGIHSEYWDFSDNNFVRVPPGTYRCLIETGNYFWCYGDIEVLPLSLPEIPILASPNNGAVDVPLYPTLCWHTSQSAASYYLEVATNDSFFNPIFNGYIGSSIDTCFMFPYSWEYSTSYYWRVKAVNTVGESGWSNIWSFTTEMNPDIIISFPDSGLRSAVLEALGRLPDDSLPIYQSEVETIIILNAASRNISNLTGIESLTNIWELSLYDNQISDITPLSELTYLTQLALASNQITDINPLSGLINLTVLGLEYNQIGDLTPLESNSGLGEGDALYISDNPLNELSIKSHIPTLTSRGVNVISNYLVAVPDTLYFTAVVGGTNPAPQNFNVLEAGGITSICYSQPATFGWLTLTNYSGCTPDNITVNIDIIEMLPGIYSDSIAISSESSFYYTVYVYVHLEITQAF